MKKRLSENKIENDASTFTAFVELVQTEYFDGILMLNE